ncbi:MAG: hypothetical protein WCT85_02855 [Parachlamydiales bacterium]|jgi:hypothetical protein
MKYLILESQIKFFQESGFIEFENIFSSEEMQKLKNEIDNYFKNSSTDFLQSYKSTRDLFRSSEFIRKFVLNNRIVSIVKNLTNRNQLRLCFDQAIYSNGSNPFDDKVLIDDFFTFQGLLCLVVIKMDDTIFNDHTFLPKTKNNSVFLKPGSYLNFNGIFEVPQKYLLIGYSDFKTIYKPNSTDPNGYNLKQLGYTHGDTLKDKTHPVIY